MQKHCSYQCNGIPNPMQQAFKMAQTVYENALKMLMRYGVVKLAILSKIYAGTDCVGEYSGSHYRL